MHLCLYIARKEPGHSRAAEAEAAKRSRAKKREAISSVLFLESTSSMSHRSRSSRSATSTASGSTSAGSGETAGPSGDGATDSAVVTPQAPGGSTEEVGTSAIRAAVLGILADPEVIRQFVAAASVPSTSGGSTEGTVGGAEAVTGEPTAPGEPVSTAPGPSGSASSAGTGKSSIVRVLLGVVRRHESRFCCCIHSTPLICTTFYLSLSGASPLGAMPSSLELSSLGLQVSHSTESPLVAASSGAAPSGLGSGTTPSGATSANESDKYQPFSLGRGFPLIPAKLVQKIQCWQYISMAELLPDNLELARRSSESPNNTMSCSSRSVRRRELSHDQNGLLAWSVCFSTFAAILGQKHPGKLKELLAYQATVIIEASRFNGRGWLPYDKMFRENVAKHPDTDWSSINPMFYSLTYLNQKVDARTCTKCMGPDHSLQECALNSLDQPQLLTPPLTPSASFQRSQEPRFRQQQQSAQKSAPPRKRAKREGTPNPLSDSNSFCFSWNEGQCSRYPKECPRRHQCIRCGGEHQLSGCTATVTLKD